MARRRRPCSSSCPNSNGKAGLSPPFLRESFCLEQNQAAATTMLGCTVTLNKFLAFSRVTMDELKLLAKSDEMAMAMLEHLYFQGYGRGARDCLMAATKFVGWIQSFSDLLRAVRFLKGYRRLALGMSRGRLPWVAAATMMGVAMVVKDDEFFFVQYMAYLRPNKSCST